MNYIPNVVEVDQGVTKTWDLYSKLLNDRVIFLGTAIDASVANSIVAQLLFLQKEDPKSDIHMYINSPGGSVTAGMAIYDTMNLISNDVRTHGVGFCASMGALLLSSGTKGKRSILSHGSVMIHQPLGGSDGQASDMQIQNNEIQRWKKALNKVLAKNTGKTTKQIEKDTDRDNYFMAKEAVKYGLVDKILKKDK